MPQVEECDICGLTGAAMLLLGQFCSCQPDRCNKPECEELRVEFLDEGDMTLRSLGGVLGADKKTMKFFEETVSLDLTLNEADIAQREKEV